MIAAVVLGSLLLSPNPADRPVATARNPTTHSADAAAAPVAPFDFAALQHLAQQRAGHEYHPTPETLPPALASLSYDQYRDIRFKSAAAMWHGQAMFEVQFFHRGYTSRQRVNVFEVGAGGVARPVIYNPEYFTFGKLVKPPRKAEDLGYAGLRIHYPLQGPAYKDELITFLGASYFRVLGRNQRYGLSARGLAIDTGLPSGEEFPTFTDFWLVRPQPNDRTLTIYALLDSKSVTGAYEFQIRPGAVTQVQVHCELYPRRAITKLGVAPLTSMFLFGEDGGRHFDDYRPQVHDSDGFMTESGHGVWIWRPLGNPRELRVNRFMDEGPRGYGLVQRERSFAHYEDAEARYELRPSYWVLPLGDWGKGGIELVEIPSDEEIHDNIVAYWVPERPVAAGKPLAFSYLLSAYANAPQWPPGGRAIATRTASPNMGDNKGHFGAGARRVLIDFAGGALDGLDGGQPVQAQTTAGNGTIEAQTVQRIPESGVWRATFVVSPKAKKPVDLQCYLTLYGEVLSETWVYQWNP